ncbi:divalent-cation tolerance protein CutA [Pseudoxanthomonas broegbernensis]|uniref:Divalent-cation tolerance protein CutA n=1 Tax=Pseudoxanthomonas broegbernensis TaxID=83619 RepID=A0A7V8GNS8_9GAMM|nr:divalent-cation tolerance protein CutA [Pseudoxanthomonas broegbernensis]KAF1687216.1 divalent-cation tolerance protein CutA [Pseudoxanthomonas broegbernensis]MBB6065797.1 periplasmic divalent cation tolerance protein [Pseudoxanthomonas broegbernensis]
MRVHLVLCSCPDRPSAETLAETLVQERLAACASVLPGLRSVYRWEGRIERAEEALLLIKTEASRVPRLMERVRALHPYELPEILTVEAAGGLPAYLAWVAAQTREGD